MFKPIKIPSMERAIKYPNISRLRNRQSTNPFTYSKVNKMNITNFSLGGMIKDITRDSDRDKMPNIIDCQPFNSRKQGVTPNALMQQRINRLPIYVTDRPISSSSAKQRRDVGREIQENKWHISSKNVPYKTKQQVYSVIKKYPNVVSQMEQSKPSAIVFTSSELVERNKTEPSLKGFKEGGSNVITVSTKDIDKKGLEGTSKVANTTSHELKHVRQFRYTPVHKLQKMFQGEYWYRPGEISARIEGAQTQYSRSDVSAKIAKQKIEKSNKYVTSREPVSGANYRKPKAEYQEGLNRAQELNKVDDTKSTESNVQRITQQADTAEEQSTKPWYKKAYEKVKSYVTTNKESTNSYNEEQNLENVKEIPATQ